MPLAENRLRVILGATIALICVAVFIWLRAGPQPVSGDGPGSFSTEEYEIRVTPVVTGLSHPWAIAFLPNGDMLITERIGRLRLVHDGVLKAREIDGIPPVNSTAQEGLLDIALHPQFTKNGLVYFTYSKPGAM